MRVALDTNVLAYAEGTNGVERKEAALRLIRRLPIASVVLPVQVLGELFNVLVLNEMRPPSVPACADCRPDLGALCRFVGAPALVASYKGRESAFLVEAHDSPDERDATLLTWELDHVRNRKITKLKGWRSARSKAARTPVWRSTRNCTMRALFNSSSLVS